MAAFAALVAQVLAGLEVAFKLVVLLKKAWDDYQAKKHSPEGMAERQVDERKTVVKAILRKDSDALSDMGFRRNLTLREYFRRRLHEAKSTARGEDFLFERSDVPGPLRWEQDDPKDSGGESK